MWYLPAEGGRVPLGSANDIHRDNNGTLRKKLMQAFVTAIHDNNGNTPTSKLDISFLISLKVFKGMNPCGVPYNQRSMAHACHLHPTEAKAKCQPGDLALQLQPQQPHPTPSRRNLTYVSMNSIKLPTPATVQQIPESILHQLNGRHPTSNHHVSVHYTRHWQIFFTAAINGTHGITLAKATAILTALFHGKDTHPDAVLKRLSDYNSDPTIILTMLKDVDINSQQLPAEKTTEQQSDHRFHKATKQALGGDAGRAMRTLESKDTIAPATTNSRQEFMAKTNAVELSSSSSTAGAGINASTTGATPTPGATSVDPQPAAAKAAAKGNDPANIVITMEELAREMQNLPTSSCGPDGFTWEDVARIHKDFTAKHTLLLLVNHYANANFPASTMRVMEGGKGIAFRKPDGSLRPICVSYVLHRLVMKILSRHLSRVTRDTTAPYQLGVGVRSGVNIAIHMQEAADNSNPTEFTLQLDITGAFSNVDRKAVKATLLSHPGLKKYIRLFDTLYPDNGEGPIVRFGHSAPVVLRSGLAQGCPASPALFALTLHTALREVDNRTGIAATAFVDDLKARGSPDQLDRFLSELTTQLATIGLSINYAKCALFCPTPPTTTTLNHIDDSCLFLRNVKMTDSLNYLGAVFGSNTSTTLNHKLSTYTDACQKVSELAQHNPQAAYVITKYSLTSRGTYLGQNHKLPVISDVVKAMDTQLLQVVSNIASSHQACTTLISLPTSQGGLGIDLPSKVANAAFISAAAATINHCTEAPHSDKAAKNHLATLNAANPYSTYLGDTLSTLRHESNHNQKIPANVADLIAKAKEVTQRSITTSLAAARHESILNTLDQTIKDTALLNGDKFARAPWSNPTAAPRAKPAVFVTALRTRLQAPDIQWPSRCCFACPTSNPTISHLVCCKALSIFHERHNRAIAETTKALRWAGWSITATEPLLSDHVPNAANKRLDIVASKGHRNIGIDFQCTGQTTLSNNEAHKSEKYRTECQAMDLDFQPIIIHTSGAAGPRTAVFLEAICNQIRTSNHVHAPKNPRAYLSGSYQFAQALTLISYSHRTIHRLAAATNNLL